MKLEGNFIKPTASYEINKRYKRFKDVFPVLQQKIAQHKSLSDHFPEENSILIENPYFQDFQFIEKGIVSKLDEQRQRFLFECRVTDSLTGATGKIQSLVVENMLEKTSYFETVTLYLEKPYKEKFKIIKLNFSVEEEEVYPKVPIKRDNKGTK
mmetsp:Transcript_30011/g.26581  ORF Transcript_30011/g.26581 Transcript_30011/m.26581 type:complete len:154 (+) Transcript_30011:244-705(+)